MAALGLTRADIAPVLGRSNDCVDVHARAIGVRIARSIAPAAREEAQARWLVLEAAQRRKRAMALRDGPAAGLAGGSPRHAPDEVSADRSGAAPLPAQPRVTTGTNI